MVPCVLVAFVRQSDVTAGLSADVDAGGETRTSPPKSDVAHHREKIDELRRQIAELDNIKMSARNELLELEHKLSQTKASLSSASKATSTQPASKRRETDGEGGENELKVRPTSRVAALDCPPPPSLAQQPAPIIILSQLKPTSAGRGGSVAQSVPSDANDGCSFPACIDYSRCPLTRPFSVYVYDSDPAHGHLPLDHVTRSELIAILNATSSLAPKPQDACLLAVTLDTRTLDVSTLERTLPSLPHWGAEGVNHVLVGLLDGPSSVLGVAKVGKAVVVGNTLFAGRRFRPGYDVLVPSPPRAIPKATDLPPILPEVRTSLLYFGGRPGPGATPTSQGVDLSSLDALRDALRDIEVVTIDSSCREGGVAEGEGEEGTTEGEWALCRDRSVRLHNHAHSTFSLVLGGGGTAVGAATFSRLMESLQAGSIPVVVGVVTLPLHDVIDWSRAVLLVPPNRFGELHYILRGIAPVTVTQYRLQGRMIWLSYCSSLGRVLSSAVAVLRQRTGHPPPIAPDYVGRTIASTGTALQVSASPSYVQNWTVYAGDIWNRPPGPFYMYPLTPHKPTPLSGVQYEGVPSSALLLLPPHIVQAGGITGEEFEVSGRQELDYPSFMSLFFLTSHTLQCERYLKRTTGHVIQGL